MDKDRRFLTNCGFFVTQPTNTIKKSVKKKILFKNKKSRPLPKLKIKKIKK